MSNEGPLFPLDFDEEALAEDLARTSEGGVEALGGLRGEIEQLGGLPHSRLKTCDAVFSVYQVAHRRLNS